MTVMILGFLVIYQRTISKVGFEYGDKILVAGMEDGNRVYSGKINNMQVKYTVTEDKTVFYQYDDQTFGPYTAVEDPAAIPEGISSAEEMTGIELRLGDSILFRGGVLKLWGDYRLYDEENASVHTLYQAISANGIQSVEPAPATILCLMDGPELKHKGQWGSWLVAFFLCVLNAISIFWADELFRLSMTFRISNAKNAEPSDLEITRRYFGWTVLAIAALVLLVRGLMI